MNEWTKGGFEVVETSEGRNKNRERRKKKANNSPSYRCAAINNFNHLVTILNDGKPTFLFQNNNSEIDLCILQGRISTSNNLSLTTDDETELLTDSPSKGACPSNSYNALKGRANQKVTKPWFEKTDWEN